MGKGVEGVGSTPEGRKLGRAFTWPEPKLDFKLSLKKSDGVLAAGLIEMISSIPWPV